MKLESVGSFGTVVLVTARRRIGLGSLASAVVHSRARWQSTALPFLFVASGLATDCENNRGARGVLRHPAWEASLLQHWSR